MCVCDHLERKCEIGDITCERDLNVVTLSETKLYGRKEQMFGKMKGIKSYVGEKMCAREYCHCHEG